MKAQKSKSFLLYERDAYSADFFSKGRTIQKNHPQAVEPLLTLHKIFKKVLQHLSKLFVALKFRVFKWTTTSNGTIQLPWFKIGFIALAAFIVFRKDVSFQVNMKSPLGYISDEATANDVAQSRNVTQNGMLGGSFAQTVSLEAKKVDPFVSLATDDAKTKRYKSYIRRFRKVAQAESKKFGIPASIKMAQALVESDAGRSKLSTTNNNHFGIKCFSRSCKKGHCRNFSDDHHKDFFRNYDSAWESWRAHSKMIVSGKYKGLLKFGNDYRQWAMGLKAKGYATSPNYADTLIKTIEAYHLQVLDE
jgi:flagellum-specific peptidoglycan hydrolase FlgJ